MSKATYVKEKEEYEGLNQEERKICEYLWSSEPIYHLIHDGCYDDINSVINFKLTSDSDRKFFKFDVADPLEPITKPILLYNVRGSIFENENVESIVYTVHSVQGDALLGTYVDNRTIVKENVILKEVFRIDNSSRKTMIVNLVIDKYPTDQDEIFDINPKSSLYRLYSRGKIDLVTFCNLVFLKSREEQDMQTKIGSNKKLSRNLIRKYTPDKM